MEKLDTFLLDNIFEPFAHKFQIYFGKNNFFLTYMSLYLLFIFSLFCVVFEALCLKYPVYTSVISFVVTVYVNYVINDAMQHMKKEETKSDEEFGIRMMNPRRKEFALKRAILVVVLSVPLFFLLYSIAENKDSQIIFTEMSIFVKLLIIVIGIYFSACTSLPKSDSKVKQWIFNFRSAFLKTESAKN